MRPRVHKRRQLKTLTDQSLKQSLAESGNGCGPDAERRVTDTFVEQPWQLCRRTDDWDSEDGLAMPCGIVIDGCHDIDIGATETNQFDQGTTVASGAKHD